MTADKHTPYIDELIEKGYTNISFDLENSLNQLINDLKSFSSDKIKKQITSLEQIHSVLNESEINDYRLSAIAFINKSSFKKTFIDKVAPFFSSVLGEDLAHQKNLNLVLVPPQDKTSILPLHTDTWTGHSEFELVILFPLTPITPEQNMFILPLPEWKKQTDLISKAKNLQDLTESLKDSFHYLNLKAGEAFVFWHRLPHGNNINLSQQSHWSINFRFKNIFTPYKEKGLGDYFVPYKLSRFNEFVFRESINEPSHSQT